MGYVVDEFCFVPLATFGSPCEALGLPLAVLWGPFGRLGVPVGSLWSIFWNILESGHQKNKSDITASAHKNKPSRDSPTDSAEVVSGTAASAPPPHAPGVRIAVVKQTPSNYLIS